MKVYLKLGNNRFIVIEKDFHYVDVIDLTIETEGGGTSVSLSSEEVKALIKLLKEVDE